MPHAIRDQLRRALGESSMLLVLAALCVALCALTYGPQPQSGGDAGGQVARRILAAGSAAPRVLIVSASHEEDQQFSERLAAELLAGGAPPPERIAGTPQDARRALARLAETGTPLDFIARSPTAAAWLVFDDLETAYPALGAPRRVEAAPVYWPTFLRADNLRNVANQISVIAILAVGMTMVIVAGGIDLSVGSLIGLSAAVTAVWIRDIAGGAEAGTGGMLLACLGGALAAGACGVVSGLCVTAFEIPPFIVTLAMMQVAFGLAGLLTQSETVHQIPASFVWLGRGADLLGIPNVVVLTGILYGAAHLLMSRTVLGRYLYAVGGNREAARLAGVPVRRVLVFAYVASGLLAGLGGVAMASEHKSGAATYGQTYELAAIAAVVVGGTSLSGGEGRIGGTLIGALIIAVIRNGMNLGHLEFNTQRIVLGAVILTAVLLDRLKRRRAGDGT